MVYTVRKAKHLPLRNVGAKGRWTALCGLIQGIKTDDLAGFKVFWDYVLIV